MKLIRFGNPGAEKPGIEMDGKRYDVSHLTGDFNEEFFTNQGIEKLKREFKAEEAKEVGPTERLGAPVSRPGKIICIGLNATVVLHP